MTIINEPHRYKNGKLVTYKEIKEIEEVTWRAAPQGSLLVHGDRGSAISCVREFSRGHVCLCVFCSFRASLLWALVAMTRSPPPPSC